MDAQTKVIELITETVKNRTNLIEQGIAVTPEFALDQIESMEISEAILAIEEAFNLPYTPQPVIDKMRTVQDVIAYVQSAKPVASNE